MPNLGAMDKPEGHYQGYGFKDFDEAMSVVDQDNPRFDVLYKIAGENYRLVKRDVYLEFELVRD